jgi:pyruvate dehydrogenase E1 component alpha subunit
VTAKAKTPTPAAKPLPRERLVAFLGEMLLIRRFEEKVEERFRAGELAGFLHACIGQEAIAVGVCRALEEGDVMGSTHRAHGHVLAHGTPANEVMAELYGKVEGCSHGYGGSMHLYDVARGTMGANAVVGGGPAGGRRRGARVPAAPRAAGVPCVLR